MAVVYVKEQGAIVQKNGGRIQINKGSRRLLELPIHSMDGLALMGNVQLTTQALQELLQHGVDISYYSYAGQYLGQIGAESSKNIFLRFAQYELYTNTEKRMEFARIIVQNKVENQILHIKNHRFSTDSDWRDDVKAMEELYRRISLMQTPNELMGMEGKCSNIYFHSFGQMFCCDFAFHGRNRRPPKDPINVIISLGYTFLTKEICTALDAESFETYLGFLHGIRYGRKSLALDVIEEFRQPIIDRMTVKLFNKRMLGKYDFELEDDRVMLNDDGFKKFCKEYERWMSGDAGGVNGGFRSVIRRQIRQLKQSIQKHMPYQPYRWGQGFKDTEACTEEETP